jgi:hypothetical protein
MTALSFRPHAAFAPVNGYGDPASSDEHRPMSRFSPAQLDKPMFDKNADEVVEFRR